MPNISGFDRSLASNNGDAGSSLLSSPDDEESFVVLERSTADGVSLICEVKNQSQSPHNGQRCSFPSLMSTSTSTYLSTGMNTCQNQGKVDPIPFDSPNISVSVEEIDKRLQEVLHENINLKENLYQTNLAMKQQLSTVRLLQDRALETQKQHQAKFEETKALIIKLGSEKSELLEKLSQLNEELIKVKDENKELKETNLAFGAEATKLLNENASLQKELASMKRSSEEKSVSLQQVSAKEMELREVIDQLTRKLEAVERARRQQDFDIDKLQAQLANHMQDRTLQAAQTDQVKNENILTHENTAHFGEKLFKYEGLLKQIKLSIQEEQSRFNSLDSWLTMTDPAVNSAQFEISELRRLLSEEQTQSVARKEKLYQAVATIHELLGDFQKLGEELERVRADHAMKESHGLAYDEMQKKGFRERLDSLTAKLVEREEALAISERHLASLQEAVRLQNDEKKEATESNTLKEQVNNLVGQVTAKDEELKLKNNEIEALKLEVQKLRGNCDTITVLEEQAKIYQADFEAERKSRESLVAEKERLVEDLRHLQRRNHELIEELNSSRGENTEATSRGNAMSSEVPRPRQTEKSPSPQPVRKIESMELQINTVFHEKQDGNLCAQHCLNALLQKAHFNAVDLAELAREMDLAEKQTLAEAGVDSKEFQSFISKPSQNMDDTGFFSVQVISCALALWGLEMVPFSSSEPRAVAARKNLNCVKAFICHSHAHWFTLRRVGTQWFNLNSTLDKPQPLSDLYLSLFLIELEKEGNFVFMVFGELPPSTGDDETTECKVIPSNVIEEVESSVDPVPVLPIVPQINQRNRPPITFTERIRLLLLNRQACNFFGL